MRTRILIATASLFLASTAFAGAGIDLSINACPGNAGAIGIDGGTVDCAGGPALFIRGTWAPIEDIPDLVAMDNILDAQVEGDLDTNGFWNFDVTGCNAIALSSGERRPGTGCETPVVYRPTWNQAGSGATISSFRNGPSTQRIGCTVYRPSPLAVSAQEKLFGFTILIDGANATESGGFCNGCTAWFELVWSLGSPRSFGAVDPTPLHSGTGNFPGFSNVMTFNAGGPVATKRHTWGQLKSLYR